MVGRPTSSPMSLTDDIKSVSNFLTGDCLKFVEKQLKMSLKDPKGRRYTDSEKLMALTIYNMSPKVIIHLLRH